MPKEYCVHTAAAARGPFFTKCGFKSKQAAQRFAQRARREGDAARVQPLAGILRDGPAAPAPAAPATPAAKPVAGWWPFGKKKPRVNPMTKRMIWVPGEAPRVMSKDTSMNPMTRHGQQILGRARKRRRR